MDAKSFIILFIAINCYCSCGAALRRTPKVYNALITTDENLTSSRAYPVIQPTIHESGYAHYPFGPYNPYGPYGSPLVRFGQPIVPGLVPREQLPYPLANGQFAPQFVPRPHNMQFHPFRGHPALQNPPTAPDTQDAAAQSAPPHQQQSLPAEEPQPIQPPEMNTEPRPGNYMPPLVNGPRPQLMLKEKLPIPLNELGLPPSLIPLPQYSPHHNLKSPVHLPPFSFNQYPLIYDPITGFREQYLPPYEYFPSNTFAINAASPGRPLLATPTSAPLPVAETGTQNGEDKYETDAAEANTETSGDNAEAIPNFDNIKNGSKSKNSDVPDVPPPPIPSGAKVKQS